MNQIWIVRLWRLSPRGYAMGSERNLVATGYYQSQRQAKRLAARWILDPKRTDRDASILSEVSP